MNENSIAYLEPCSIKLFSLGPRNVNLYVPPSTHLIQHHTIITNTIQQQVIQQLVTVNDIGQFMSINAKCGESPFTLIKVTAVDNTTLSGII